VSSTRPLVYRLLEEVVVEVHAEGLQVQVLLVAQVGHRELADAVQVVTSPLAVNSRSSACTVLPAEVGRDVGDVVAVVGLLGPLRVAGLEALAAALRGLRQVLICTPASL
jgi:hypothetical protein